MTGPERTGRGAVSGERDRAGDDLVDPPGDDPMEVFSQWFEAARVGGQPEPEAAALATSTAGGRSSVRFVLIRGVDRRGFVFYTNRHSRKGQELAANPQASLAFRWSVVDRQVRVVGPVSLLDDAASDAYFAGRPRGSQFGAWASEQSRPVASKADLEQQLAAVAARFGDGPVPRPPWWGGYRVEPVEMEFWQQGVFRMHDRFAYRLEANGGWSCQRLNP
ncbi:MAG: pyridoxamine 5'-phosphate oxidase [Actinomycetota bacterium]|nr:pyridoxamine 5'-phosphate oxidase [Actinomycetota bacterium]